MGYGSPSRDISLFLELHPKKVTLTTHHRGIDFLGYVILPEHIKMRSKTKRRIPRKLRECVSLYKNGLISKVSLKSTLESYMGVISHADAYTFGEEMRNNFWFWLNE